MREIKIVRLKKRLDASDVDFNSTSTPFDSVPYD